MSSNLTLFRVFIASPGGLNQERESFRNALRHYNDSDAIERGVYFLPIGWEGTLGGLGRPQELINSEIRRCDYMILLLWDRWGSPPSADVSKYTSGTEEELHVALEAVRDQALPMRDVIVFFKSVDIRQLSDPGDGLNKVLQFRTKLEGEKTLTYSPFDNAFEFTMKLQAHLARWTRHHEQGTLEIRSPYKEPAQVEPRSLTRFMGAPMEPEGSPKSGLVLQADELANKGRYTEAEMIFARAVTRGDDPDAMNRYGNFLRVMKRFEKAELLVSMAVEWAKEAKDEYWLGISLNNLAALHYDQAKYPSAKTVAEKAQRILETKMGQDDLSVANSLDHIGNASLAMTEYKPAQKCLERACEIRERRLAKDHPDLATSYNNIAALHRAQRSYGQAESFYKKALAIMDRVLEPRQNEVTRSLHGLGIIYYEQKRFGEAESMLHRALDITKMTLPPDHPFVARSYHDLGMLRSSQGKLAQAEELLRSALDSAEQALGPNNVNLAYGLAGLADLYHAQGREGEAEALLSRALKIREKSLPAHHPLMVPILDTYSSVLEKTGGIVEASEMRLRASLIRKQKGIAFQTA